MVATIIITLSLGFATGSFVTWLATHKVLSIQKIREFNAKKIDDEVQRLAELQEVRFSQHILIHENAQKIDVLKTEIKDLEVKRATLNSDITHLFQQQVDLQEALNTSQEAARLTAESFLLQQMELVGERLDKQLEQVALKYQQDEEAYKQQYLKTIKEYAIQFQADMQSIQNQRMFEERKLQEIKALVDSAVETAKREEEKRQYKNFYRLVLPESDLAEIAQLRAVEPFLRDKEALNKVIWKVYYEKPYTDMVGRVVGQKVKTGIYKITNIDNQMCYIGQAVDIADRWRQHIKRGLGAETPTRNKLYPAMSAAGVENFTFEILQECDREHLTEKELYWQQFYQAREFGYSIK